MPPVFTRPPRVRQDGPFSRGPALGPAGSRSLARPAQAARCDFWPWDEPAAAVLLANSGYSRAVAQLPISYVAVICADSPMDWKNFYILMSYLKTIRLPLGMVLLSLAAGCQWYTTAVNTGIDVGTMLAADRSLYNVADDFAIKSEITEAIFDEALLLTVSTDVYQGMVMLTGTVKDGAAKKQAEKHARRVTGVREVFNEIQVTDEVGITATVGDLVIENKLKAYLFMAPGVSSINFRWRAVNGVVYFMGIAKSRKELDKVLSVAHLHGVTKIITHIFLSDQFVVDGPPPSPIEEKVAIGKNNGANKPEARATNKKPLIEPATRPKPPTPAIGEVPEMPTYFERRMDQLY